VSTFANDQATELALGRLAGNARLTVARLTEALEAAGKVRDEAEDAAVHGLSKDNLSRIRSEALKLASASFFAREHGDLVTNIAGKLTAEEGS
jgi:hypothetical protein